MPPRKSTPVTEWAFRISPTDQEPIGDWTDSGLKDAELVVVCEEGIPNGSPKLHYHGYIKSQISRTSLERICAKLGKSTSEVKGNAVFSIKQANTGTIGYTVKGRNVVYNNGYTNHQLEEFFELSDQYRKDLEANRRQDTRKKTLSYKEIFDAMVISATTTSDGIVTELLDECRKRKLNFPPRSLVETNVMRLLFPFKPMFVTAFYLRNMEARY